MLSLTYKLSILEEAPTTSSMNSSISSSMSSLSSPSFIADSIPTTEEVKEDDSDNRP